MSIVVLAVNVICYALIAAIFVRVAFSWIDGSSRCDAFRLRSVEAFEEDGYVFVRAGGQGGGGPHLPDTR